MKAWMYTIFFFSLISSEVIGQCTDGGLKVQSNTCEPPQNLIILSLGCTEIKLGWMGSKNGNYVVKAMLQDSAKGTTTVKEQQVMTSETGAGQITIKVNSGTQVSWSVQAVYSSEAVKMYSKEVAGVDTTTPFCPILTGNSSIRKLIAYPNPAKNYLMIEYELLEAGAATFSIYNMEGKKLIRRTEPAFAGVKNTYKLNIASLPPGTYFLKTSNEKENSSEVKFLKAEK